ncbi:MAG: carboxy-S-adenosyl-L-methionine synthase CmoA [Woeseiaceae bacterium]
MSKDKIYTTAKDAGKPFRFNQAVADVFPDMLQRSIPGYAASIEAIESLAARYVTSGSTCYDLGCSLGAATLAMRAGINAAGCKIVAVDNAAAMVERCRDLVSQDTDPQATPVDVRQADIQDTAITNAAMVVMNYTLQFLDVDTRDDLLARIFDGMLPGGIFVLSEKVVDDDQNMEELLVDLHHEHKRRNDYSQLEIARKRAALENVLIPETVATHRRRLADAGFEHSAVWLRYFNFVSIVALKSS